MKIGLFSDSYHPSTNGIAVIIDILHDNFVALGHEVVIVAPRPGLRPKHGPSVIGKNIVWIPAIEGLFFDEYLTSVFSPTITVRKIEKQQLDSVIIFTPAQVGLLGAYIAKRNKIPLVEQYSTDLSDYIKQYPSTVIGMFALAFSAPFALKMNLADMGRLTKTLLGFKRNTNIHWSADMTAKALAIMHNNTDLVIALSDKLASQMRNDGVIARIKTIPNGVNALPANMTEARQFRSKYLIKSNEKIVLYVGRLSVEKNLDLLLGSFIEIANKHKDTKLVFVGDFNYRESLQSKAESSNFSNQIIFTGRIPRSELGSIYETCDIFAFPSLTDTQAIVLNEASHAGLPIVWCDEHLNSVAQHEINGLCTSPNIKNFSNALDVLLNDSTLRQNYSNNSKILAHKFNEQKMTKKLLDEILKI